MVTYLDLILINHSDSLKLNKSTESDKSALLEKCLWQHTMTGKIKQISNTTLKHKPPLWTRKFPDLGITGTQDSRKKELGL